MSGGDSGGFGRTVRGARAPYLRLALRGLRGGLAGFRIFLACIAIGVAAIVGVGSVSHGFLDGLARQGRVILGGDVSFAQTHRELSAAERSWMQAHGSLSAVALLRAMARAPNGGSTLIDLKAVGLDWPSAGSASVAPDRPIPELLAPRDGVDGLIADAALSAKLNLSVGDRIKIGDQTFALRATLISEPDSLSAGFALGPRVIITQDALRHTDLLQPGALVRWIYRVSLEGDHTAPVSDAQAQAFVKAADAAFPSAGWETHTRADVSPQFAKSLEQLTQFLTLVGLTALIVGGGGVANAARAFVERKREEFATFKALGAAGSSVFFLSLAQVMAVAAIGVAIGLSAGACMPFLLAWGLASVIPIPFSPSLYPGELAAGALYGFLTALAFSIGPLGRAHDAPVATLFRDRVDSERSLPRARYLVALAVAAITLVAAMVLLATDRRIAVIYVLAACGGFALLRAVSWAIMAAARHAPHLKMVEMRLAVANIHRPGALTPSVVLALGLGLALLVALTFIDGNLRNEIGKATPGQTPSLFFLDVPSGETQAFGAFVHAHAPSAKLEEVPMMQGRITRLNGVASDKVKSSEDAARVLKGDRGITYASDPPDGSVVVAGTWWPPNYSGAPLVSMDARIAQGLRLKIGDTITVNVLGRDVTARIANLRKVNWRTLGINFILVFSPNAFAGAPHTTLAAATFPKLADESRGLKLLREVANAYPTITVLSVKDALDALNQLLDKVALAIRSASSVALLSATLVLGGAIASGQRNRIYDAVILKTLGATRGRLLLALVMEYALLGLAAAVFGVIAGVAAAYVILTRVMDVDTVSWLWGSAILSAVFALVATVALGLLGTYRALGQKPAALLRSP